MFYHIFLNMINTFFFHYPSIFVVDDQLIFLVLSLCVDWRRRRKQRRKTPMRAPMPRESPYDFERKKRSGLWDLSIRAIKLYSKVPGSIVS